jgi:hypothetical protein
MSINHDRLAISAPLGVRKRPSKDTLKGFTISLESVSSLISVTIRR